MPKSKTPTPKQRRIPYSRPAIPSNPNSHSSTSTAPPTHRSTPSAPQATTTRTFPPPPNFASRRPGLQFTPHTLTPFEEGQSFRDFCLDQQNGTQRPYNVDESVRVRSIGIRGLEGDDKSASGNSEVGQGAKAGRRRRVEKVVASGGDGVGERGSAQKTPRLRNSDYENVDAPFRKRQNQLPTGSSFDLPSNPGPCPPDQNLDSPKQSSLPDLNLAAPNTLQDEEILFAELLKPVSEFNAGTPWPKAFHEQPIPPPAWHADCPEGYEPTTLAGYPQRRQYPTYIPAAHDVDIVRDEYGHYCVDLDPWDQCVMGKCRGCEICRPHN